MRLLILALLFAALSPAALRWTGHGREYAGMCGRQRVVMIVYEQGGWSVYDQRESDTPERPGTLVAVGLPDRQSAQRRAAVLVRCGRR